MSNNVDMMLENKLIAFDKKIQNHFLEEARKNGGPTNAMKLLVDDLQKEFEKNSTVMQFVLLVTKAYQNKYDDYLGEGPYYLMKDMELYLLPSAKESAFRIYENIKEGKYDSDVSPFCRK